MQMCRPCMHIIIVPILKDNIEIWPPFSHCKFPLSIPIYSFFKTILKFLHFWCKNHFKFGMQSLVLKCLKGRPATLCNWQGPIRSEERTPRNATTKIVYHENWVQGLRMEEPEFWKDRKVEIWNYEHSSLRRRHPKLCVTQRERIKESEGTMKTSLLTNEWLYKVRISTVETNTPGVMAHWQALLGSQTDPGLKPSSLVWKWNSSWPSANELYLGVPTAHHASVLLCFKPQKAIQRNRK
jgi:hypothetical protein